MNGDKEQRTGDVHQWPSTLDAGDPEVEAFTQEMRRLGAPHHLAKYDHGVYEFSLDVLGGSELVADFPEASPDRQEYLRAAGQQLAFAMGALDGELAGADTGRLIRTVVHAEYGALYSVSVTPKNYVLGIVFGHATPSAGDRTRPLPQVALVRDADKYTCWLSDTLRRQIGLPTQNPGGWQTEDDQLNVLANPPGELHRRPLESSDGDRLERLLHPFGLAYLARCKRGKIVQEADLFAHPRVAQGRPAQVGPDEPRLFYRRLTQGFAVYARELSQTARQAVRGRVLRIVLDVEQGAVYYYRIGPADYLVGVTINQARVSQSDDMLGRFAADLLNKGASKRR
jgi:hypothetical protein